MEREEACSKISDSSGKGKGGKEGFSFKSLFGWTTRRENSDQSEYDLLNNTGCLAFDDSKKKAELFKVFLAPKQNYPDAPPHYMNTLEIKPNFGEGPAATSLVLCHGFGAGLGFWYRNLHGLSSLLSNRKIIAVDWLGMGKSSRPPFPKFGSTGHQTQDAIDFFLDSFEEWRSKQNNLDKFILVGHSMGGYLGALYALRHPERVEKLILASPVGLPAQIDGVAVTGHKIPTWVTHLWNKNYTPQGIVRAMGPMGPRFAQKYVDKRFPFLPAVEKTLLGKYFYHISADSGSGEYALAALLAPGAWAREPLHTKLSQLRVPVSFIYGENDWMDKNHAIEASNLMNVNVSIRSVSDAGHHLNIDNPEEFNKVLGEELETSSSGTTIAPQ